MDTVQAIILALLQGITEFLPVSSSAHLILLPKLLGWESQSDYFNLIVHFGTLTALVFYYRKSLRLSATQTILNSQQNPLLLMAVGSIPVFVCGYLLEDFITNHLYTITVIAITTITFALLLGYADRQNHHSTSSPLMVSHAFLIGLAQALALVPGTSRMGITLTAALLLGFSKTVSTHFSLLLAIPVILAATGYKSLSLIGEAPTEAPVILLLGFAVSAVFAFATIHLFVAFVERVGMLPFVVYRLLLGAVLLLMI